MVINHLLTGMILQVSTKTRSSLQTARLKKWKLDDDDDSYASMGF